MTHPIGTELRSPHGTRWVKLGEDEWYARVGWGVLDMWTLYLDNEVYGEVIAEGVTK